VSQELLDEFVPGWRALSRAEFRQRRAEVVGRHRAQLRAAFDAALEAAPTTPSPAEPEASAPTPATPSE
jgi:hypothetical protein